MLETLSQGIFDEGLLNLNLAKTYLRRDLEDKEDYGEMLLAEVGDYVAEGEDLVMVHAETRYTLEDGYHTSQVELRVNSEEGSRSYWFNSEEGVLRMWGNTSKVEEARTHSGTIESLYAVSMSGVLPAIETWEPELDEKVAEMGE